MSSKHNQGYVVVPNTLFTDPRLDPYEKVIYGFILSYAYVGDKEGQIKYFSRAYISKCCGISDGKVKTALKKLLELGIMEKIETKKGFPNTYKIEVKTSVYFCTAEKNPDMGTTGPASITTWACDAQPPGHVTPTKNITTKEVSSTRSRKRSRSASTEAATKQKVDSYYQKKTKEKQESMGLLKKAMPSLDDDIVDWISTASIKTIREKLKIWSYSQLEDELDRMYEWTITNRPERIQRPCGACLANWLKKVESRPDFEQKSDDPMEQLGGAQIGNMLEAFTKSKGVN